MKTFLKIIIASTFFVAVSCQKQPEGKELIFATTSDESRYEYAALNMMKSYIEQSTGGKIIVTIRPNGTVGNDKEVVEGMKSGRNFFATVSVGVATGDISYISKELSLLSLPFLFDSSGVAYAVMDGVFGQKLLQTTEQNGLIALKITDLTQRVTVNNKYIIDNLTDYKELNIRTAQNQPLIEAYTSIGAKPFDIPFAEVKSQIQNGNIDGIENSVYAIKSNHLAEQQRFLTVDHHGFDWKIFLIGKKQWDLFTEKEQKIILEGVDIADQYIRRSAVEDNSVQLDELAKQGVTITTFDNVTLHLLMSNVRPILNSYGMQIDPTLYVEMLDEIQKADSTTHN